MSVGRPTIYQQAMTPAERKRRSRQLDRADLEAHQAGILKRVPKAERRKDRSLSPLDRWYEIGRTLEDLEEMLLRHPPEAVEINIPELIQRVRAMLARLSNEARRVPFVDDADLCPDCARAAESGPDHRPLPV